MKFIVFVLLILFSTISMAANDTKNILNKLIIMNNLESYSFVWNRDDWPWSSIETNTIYWTNLAERMCNKSRDAVKCKAGILAHELVHLIKRHPYSTKPREIEADRGSVALLREAGYDPCSMIVGFEAVIKIRGGDPKSRSDIYPDLDKRIEIVRKECTK